MDATMKQYRKYYGMFVLATIASSAPSHCETLTQAIESALRNNAALAEAKAKQKTVVEQVQIARSGGLPTISLNSGLQRNYEPYFSTFSNPTRNETTTVSLTAPLYSGGAIRHAVKAARWGQKQGAASLLSATAGLTENVISTYVQIFAMRRHLEIYELYIKELEESLHATGIRLAAGELTKTDISQVRTALDSAKGTYFEEVAALRSQEARFTYLVGHEPGDLAAPPPLPKLPTSEQEAIEIALQANPDISSSKSAVQAAQENSKSVAGSRLPKLQAFATGNYTDFLGSAASVFGPLSQQVRKTGEMGLSLSLPIYQGGQGKAQLRIARDQELEAESAARDVADEITSAVRSQFAAFQLLNQEMAVTQDEVTTAEDAYAGVTTLSRLGDRNTQDVLNADEAVLNAKNQLIDAEANRYIAATTLLQNMGTLLYSGGDPNVLGKPFFFDTGTAVELQY